jgi:hypothetical protein
MVLLEAKEVTGVSSMPWVIQHLGRVLREGMRKSDIEIGRSRVWTVSIGKGGVVGEGVVRTWVGKMTHSYQVIYPDTLLSKLCLHCCQRYTPKMSGFSTQTHINSPTVSIINSSATALPNFPPRLRI